MEKTGGILEMLPVFCVYVCAYGRLDHTDCAQHKEPEGQAECAEQGGHHDSACCDNTPVSHIFCHDKAAAGGSTAQHDQNGNELFLPESQPDGNRQKQHAE